ncbi:related to rhamnosidase B [Rhynchosporium secalis]|uniref:Related to rhamnosidase B n=1 Tax=Rhynchosporium secalis TaxID=38038 RepID=A0A1E1MA96_RHYSE|nr:related to rhamnosidase B [Rhynchosporium secalis]
MTSKVPASEQETINRLNANWVWHPDWVDSSTDNTAGRIVRFSRHFVLSSQPNEALLHFSADTRYKLYVNGTHVAIGPSRSSLLIWYYDSLDIAPFLKPGENEIVFLVLRYYVATRTASPFERTAFPGLTVYGSINERISPISRSKVVTPRAYGMGTLNGDLLPWRLRKRSIPMYEESDCVVNTIRACKSAIELERWNDLFGSNIPLSLPSGSYHKLDLQADVHSTAFVRWKFKTSEKSSIKIKVTYSEGYELEPRSYPFFRNKKDRLNAEGLIIGPFDEVELDLVESQSITYEPFWFRTFRVLRLEIFVGSGAIEFESFEATQINYPLALKSSWIEPGDDHSEKIWEVSIRTMRNCMFDGYSDCPFYEQLQYSGDSRQVGLFHYLISGDDRLMRQAISDFAASVTYEGLTQSRFPSHVPQIIAGFSLYWVLQVCDHHLFFGDTAYSRSFLPRIDGVLEFFNSQIDDLGLVSDLPYDAWQFVDWVTTWGATDSHPDKGVPTSGRKSNRHTYFSMLYAYTLKQAANLLREVGRPGHADEYESRISPLLRAIRKHCYDGKYFTDSTADIADDLAYSEHSQVWAVLSGAADPEDAARLLATSFQNVRFSKCSYMMRFYALRAFAIAGDGVYESVWTQMWDPWRDMLADNLTTWAEDDVRQRSDCHAWGSVPIYEYCTELAGIFPLKAGSAKISFKPRLTLSREIEAKVALGKDNVATVSWKTDNDGHKRVRLQLEKPAEVVSKLPGAAEVEHGVVDSVDLEFHLIPAVNPI